MRASLYILGAAVCLVGNPGSAVASSFDSDNVHPTFHRITCIPELRLFTVESVSVQGEKLEGDFKNVGSEEEDDGSNITLPDWLEEPVGHDDELLATLEKKYSLYLGKWNERGSDADRLIEYTCKLSDKEVLKLSVLSSYYTTNIFAAYELGNEQYTLTYNGKLIVDHLRAGISGVDDLGLQKLSVQAYDSKALEITFIGHENLVSVFARKYVSVNLPTFSAQRFSDRSLHAISVEQPLPIRNDNFSIHPNK